MNIKEIEEIYEGEVIENIIACWEMNKELNRRIENKKIRKDKIDKAMNKSILKLKEAYVKLLDICHKLVNSDSKVKSGLFRFAVSFSESLNMYENAFNLARSAVDTAHGRKWFRAAIKRTEGKRNQIKDSNLMKVDLEELTSESIWIKNA